MHLALAFATYQIAQIFLPGSSQLIIDILQAHDQLSSYFILIRILIEFGFPNR